MRNDVGMTTLAYYAFQAKTTQTSFIPEGVNTLKLELVDGVKREITHVRINRSFVFGLLEDSSSWCLIRLNNILGIRFQTQELVFSPPINWTRKAAGELITSRPLPAQARINFQKSREIVDATLMGSARGLLATDSQFSPFVPIQAISYIEISAKSHD